MTLRHVAERVGCSVWTASLALRDNPRIKPDKRKKVRAAARKLGYVPNLQARSLRTQRTHRIGVLIPKLDNPFYIEPLWAMYRVAAEAGYELCFECTQWDIQREHQIIDYFLGQRVDGLIVTVGRTPERMAYLKKFVETGRPACSLDSLDTSCPGLSCVATDRSVGMYEAVKHLIELGHRRIALLHPAPHERLGEVQDFSVDQRMQGIRQALAEAGLDEGCVYRIPCQSAYTAEAREAMIDLVVTEGVERLPTAILSGDLGATGVIAGLYACKVSVPEQVSVVGFDNIEASAFTTPALTTVDQFPARHGRQAIELIIRQLEDGELKSEQIVEPAKLVIRESTAPARDST